MTFSSDQIFIAAFVLQSITLVMLAAEIISSRKKKPRDPQVHQPTHLSACTNFDDERAGQA